MCEPSTSMSDAVREGVMTITTMPNDANPKELEEWRSRGELRGNDNLARDSIFKQAQKNNGCGIEP